MIFGSNRRVVVRRSVSERMISSCGSHREAWRRCDGALMVTLSVIYLEFQGTLNKHGYHSILQQSAIPFGFRLVGLSFVCQQDNDPKHTFRLCKGYLTKKESDGVLHQMTWPLQLPDLHPIEMVWDELDCRVKESQQVLSICGNSFKTVGKPFQV